MHALSFESVILHLLQLGVSSKSKGLCLPHTSLFTGIFTVVIAAIFYCQISAKCLGAVLCLLSYCKISLALGALPERQWDYFSVITVYGARISTLWKIAQVNSLLGYHLTFLSFGISVVMMMKFSTSLKWVEVVCSAFLLEDQLAKIELQGGLFFL